MAKRGVSFSSDLVQALSVRGIKLLFLGFKGTAQATLIGNTRHGVVAARANQYRFCQGNTLPLARKVIEAKIKNQRGVINYHAKYHKLSCLEDAAVKLKQHASQTATTSSLEKLLGYEGVSARIYFNALKEARLFSSSFKKRYGRGSKEINNSMLNFGYAILSSYILAAIENAGLEPYMGFIHTPRPGKMSLVLDIMEEYRAWVVDRAVVKLRNHSEGKTTMDSGIKRLLIEKIQETCAKKYLHQKKKVKLEHIIQRQVYRLSGQFCGTKKYRPYLFKW